MPVGHVQERWPRVMGELLVGKRVASTMIAWTAIFLVVLSACQSDDGVDERQGTLTGNISIGPLCPVEPCAGPVTDVYSSRTLILRPKSGDPLHVSLDADGNFETSIRAGVFTLDLSDCEFLGCSFTFPRTVTILPDQVTRLDIDLDTGIR